MPVTNAGERPLQGLRVVDIAGSIAGAYCARLFAEQGADVVVVGDETLPTRQHDYLRIGVPNVLRESVRWEEIDVVIESSASYAVESPATVSGRTIRVQVSPFGSSGPRSSWQSSDLVDYAISGHAHLYGDPDRAPLPGPPQQPAVAAGIFAFIGAMAALLDRERTGHGQPVEVTHHETMVALHQMTLLRWMASGERLGRLGNRYTGQGQPNTVYPCADGWLAITCVTDDQVNGLLAVTGLSHLLEHPEITSGLDFQHHPELIEGPLRAWLAAQQVDDVVELFQAMRVPTCPLRSPSELIDDPQLAARNFLRSLDDGSGRSVPGPPFSRTHHQPAGGRAWVPGLDGAAPLAGLRVLDLARVWAGPLCARILADLGADVIWVEAPLSRGPREIPQSFIDATGYIAASSADERPWNRNLHLAKYSLGKRSLAVDLQHDRGREALELAIAESHVLLENFSPRVMPQLGLDEDRLHAVNPDLIYLTMPGYGRSGPARDWLAYGSCVDSHAGLSSLIGYEGEAHRKGGIAWPDPIAGLHACAAVLASVWASATGRAGGCTIEAAQFESTIAAIGHELLPKLMPPGVAERPKPASISEVVRCAGDDRWIAVTAPDPAALAAALGSLPAHLRPATAPADPGADIGAELAMVAERSDPFALAEALQSLGIAAAPVTWADDVIDDPHLRDRDMWNVVEQPDIGQFAVPRTPIRLDGQPLPDTTPAPTLGQHNSEILRSFGATDGQIRELAAMHVIVDEPPR